MPRHDEVLEHLKNGIRKFRRDVYAERADRYLDSVSRPQEPHTLLITCADSRIDPETITSSSPGEIFVTRNIGNMVPAYGEMLGGVSAVVEYAVDALKVKHVVICGHTDCGAMKGILQGDAVLDSMPTVKHWLRNADAAERVAATVDGGTPSLKTLTEQNVLLQMTHLRTHPSVAGALARGALTVSGWIYDIGHGEVLIFDEDDQRFAPVTADDTTKGERPVAFTSNREL